MDVKKSRSSGPLRDMTAVPNYRVTAAMMKIYMLTFFSDSGSSLHSSAIFLISSEFFASMD